MKQNQQFRAVGLILLVMALIIFASSLTQQTGLFGDEMTHQEFMVAVENKAIEFVRINQNQQPPTGSLEIWLTDGDKTVLAVSDVTEMEDLLDGYRLSFYCGVISSWTSPDPSNAQVNLNFLMIALAHAKRTNSSEVCIYDDSIHQEEQLRQYIEANMYRALDEGEYQVYLQPKMNLRTGKIESAEALVRWHTKDRGLLLPSQFVPLFEQNGFCKHLDLYMLEQSCAILKSWKNEGLPKILISINQTKSLFVSDDYLDKLLEITSRYEIDPQDIVLEILEGLAFENIAELNDSIARLHQAGFRVSMDDFGSGYSSLNTLGKLHIDQIKLDRMFLMDLKDEQRSSQNDVMLLIFELAKKLGIETVTEGVETKEDEAFIKSMGCNYGQGYYYSKPIPANEFRTIFLMDS